MRAKAGTTCRPCRLTTARRASSSAVETCGHNHNGPNSQSTLPVVPVHRLNGAGRSPWQQQTAPEAYQPASQPTSRAGARNGAQASQAACAPLLHPPHLMLQVRGLLRSSAVEALQPLLLLLCMLRFQLSSIKRRHRLLGGRRQAGKPGLARGVHRLCQQLQGGDALGVARCWARGIVHQLLPALHPGQPASRGRATKPSNLGEC